MFWTLVTAALFLSGECWGVGTNVALTSWGASCEASSYDTAGRQEHKCEKALDGFTNPLRIWRSDGDGADAWILITFAQKYDLVLARFMQVFSAEEHIKDIRLTFDGNVSRNFTLCQHNGTDSYDVSVASWEDFTLDVSSQQVLIEVVSVYTSGNNGFTEVEFHADVSNCQTDACLLENVALASRGATCNSSASVAGEGCEKAIDGIALYGTHQWSSDGTGVGTWLEIRFDKTYELVHVRVMQKTKLDDQFRNIRLEFDNDIQAQIFLPRHSSDTDWDSKQMWWDEFDLYPVKTSYVRMTAVDVHRTGYNGFMEVEFYAKGSATFSSSNQDGSCQFFGVSLSWVVMVVIVCLGLVAIIVLFVVACRCRCQNKSGCTESNEKQDSTELRKLPSSNGRV